MPKSFYHKAKFLLSVASLSQLPEDVGAEVAFIGRSNSGKSSALNALTQQKNLARISKTPGRTQLINFFGLNDESRLVDLPGYGYAKVPAEIKAHWAQLIDDYLCNRDSLKGLVLIMDCRHPLQHFDLQILDWAAIANLPVHILLTKADKLKFGAKKSVLMEVTNKIKSLAGKITAQLFSATHHEGVDELCDQLDLWFNIVKH